MDQACRHVEVEVEVREFHLTEPGLALKGRKKGLVSTSWVQGCRLTTHCTLLLVEGGWVCPSSLSGSHSPALGCGIG